MQPKLEKVRNNDQYRSVACHRSVKRKVEQSVGKAKKWTMTRQISIHELVAIILTEVAFDLNENTKLVFGLMIGNNASDCCRR